jgi:hypothetical protein
LFFTMSYVRLNIADSEKILSGEVHGGEAEAFVAALSAEPETVAELEYVFARFVRPSGASKPLARFAAHENFEPYDAGIVVIDLAARIIACDSTYFSPVRKGAVFYHDGSCKTDVSLRFRLPDDWLFAHSIPEYEGVARRRRAERAAIEPLDARKILYGAELCEFLAAEIFAAENPGDPELFADVHEKWLMTARADLSGKTPREILLEKKDLIDDDLFSRETQWSFTGECPPPIPTHFHAYRFAGFGTHEIVIYYDLIRFLLEHAVAENASAAMLERLKDQWLETPSAEFHYRSPAQIVEQERKRIPPALSPEDAIIDHDCPMCQMMAEEFDTPMFWHLDGCNMDERFAFSFYRTREEWEEEQRRWRESDEEYYRRQDDSFFDENEFIADDSQTTN